MNFFFKKTGQPVRMTLNVFNSDEIKRTPQAVCYYRVHEIHTAKSAT